MTKMYNVLYLYRVYWFFMAYTIMENKSDYEKIACNNNLNCFNSSIGSMSTCIINHLLINL